jgi:dTDP-4-dehydrorhamnose reductase
MRVVLLGAGGLAAREIIANAPAGHTVIPFTHAQLDIRDGAAVRQVIRESRPDWVINASGVTDVDVAERNAELAFAVNAEAVGALATMCADFACGLAHFSTDFVFDGEKRGCYTEADAPRPINTYGASKLAGEQLVARNAPRHLIIRTQWIFGLGGRGFISSLWQRARDRLPTRVVADQFGGCTYAVDLARMTWSALPRLTGTYHIANRGRVSRHDLAQRIFGAADAADLVSAMRSADEPPGRAARPASTTLCVEKVERALGVTMPDWTDALSRYESRLASERAGSRS